MYKSNISKEKIESLIKEIGNYYDINLNDILSSNAMSYSITTHEITSKLFDAYNLYMSGKLELSYIILGKLLLLDNTVKFDIKNLEQIQKISKFILFSSVEYNNFCDWYENYKEIWNCYVEENPLRNENDSVNTYDPTHLYKLDKLLFGKYGLLKELVYKKGNSKLDLSTWQINNAFVLTNNLSLYLNNLKPRKDNITYFSVLFNIHEIPEISNFVFIVQYKDYIWVFDDSTSFANPGSASKMAQRNFRFRENNWENFPLSYDSVFDKLEKFRDNKISKIDNNFELYTEDIIENWTSSDKDNLRFIIELIFPRLYDISKEAMFLHEHINYSQKAIGVAKNKNINDKFININEEECMRNYNDIVLDKKPINKNKELSKINNSGIILSNINNSLMTVEEFEKVAAWEINSAKKEKIEKELNDIDEEKDTIKIKKLLIENKDIVYKRCLTTEKIIIAEEELCRHNSTGSSIVINAIIDKNELLLTDISLSKDNYFKNYILSSNCRNCGERKTNKEENTIKIHHYAQLMYYLGINDRNKLPKAYINFKSDAFSPYAGNTLLDNVNPLFTIKNSFNYKHRYGIKLKLGLCKICEKRILKKYEKIFCVMIDKNGNVLKEYKNEEEYKNEIKTKILI